MPRIPIDLSTGTLKDTQVIVGIDLGTTHSLIARVLEGQPQCIADHGHDVIVPSLIYFDPQIGPIVGEEARPYLTSDPSRTLYSIKRLLGRSHEEIAPHAAHFSYRIVPPQTALAGGTAPSDGMVQVVVDGRYYSPVELSALILKELKARAEHRLKTDVNQAVITVPAYFNDAQRQATRDAGKLAGLDVLRIVNEPTAAALAYGMGLGADDDRTVAVYDLGGGTFDVTILRIEGGVFEVLSTHGDTYLGGDDLDRALAHHWTQAMGLNPDTLAADKAASQRLRLLAEAAKRQLSAQDSFSGEFAAPGGSTHTLEITRLEFENLIEPLVSRTIQSVDRALADAELRAEQIDAVVLVGGSTRVPLVKQRVAERFGRQPFDQLNPDEVVALGAAVQADILAGNRPDLLLLDVTPLSLGIETGGGLMDVLIPRNSKVPTRASRQYTTQVDGQVNLSIRIYQGERERVADNRLLAACDLRGIPAMPAGFPRVEITFALDADGILKVTAQEQHSGLRQEVVVQPRAGLTDAEVEQMLLSSFENAQSDMAQRLVTEAQEKGRQLIYQAERFLAKQAAHFAPEEAAETRRLMHTLEQTIPTADKDRIQAAIEALNDYTKPIAARVMDAAVRQAVGGTSVDAWG